MLTGVPILYYGRRYLNDVKFPHLEFSLMFLLTILMMSLFIGSNSLKIAFLCLVGFSLCVYVLITFDPTRGGHREAGSKYYYLSVFSSGLLVFGVFLMYALTRQDTFELLHTALSDTHTYLIEQEL